MSTCKKCRKEIPDAPFCPWCGTKQTTERKQNTKHRGNGQGTVWKMPSGKYRATVTIGSWVDETGKIHLKRTSRTFAKKSDAIAALPEMHQKVPEKRDITLHDLYDIFTSTRDYDALSKSQKDKLGYAWKRWAPLEFRGVSTLTVDDIQTTIDTAVQTYYPARDMKVILSHLYKIAVRKEIVPLNKTDNVELPEQPKAKRECWKKEEIDLMWEDYKTHPFTGYILIMCYAGMRYGELAKLELENIHLPEQYMIGGIKSEAGIDREIPIHKRIIPVIEALSKNRKKKLLEMNEDNFYIAYWEMIERTGLRKLPPHTCRHYYFSSMTAAGIQGGIIAEIGGHANYLTTLKNYVRVPLEDKINAVNAIE